MSKNYYHTMHPVAQCFLDGTARIRNASELTGMDYGFLLWTQLGDTPYTQGVQELAGWTSKADSDKAKGAESEMT